ncbi:hypothetical protein AAHA92_13994 [Salvia divinorum]|uniref:Uncharacterized protein n=1 Tax=Salvia divinorum TaxID=28513 RepID=A0ABD1HE65_SALDI
MSQVLQLKQRRTHLSTQQAHLCITVRTSWRRAAESELDHICSFAAAADASSFTAIFFSLPRRQPTCRIGADADAGSCTISLLYLYIYILV